ncbi:MAG TPA: murein biosynthesis integral membrane protein MurJ [Phycisphaerae bacterium]|nr:murein biosynthesis integral membrane protein MurJ [Phycisphaerae bacterium]HRW53053.1 murein biosynthesis integral membrane protein MurJ [Phycisphaerae bacterium]
MSSQHSRFVGSARILAICTLCSRVTGLVRDMVMNRVFGQGWVQDAFNYGFIIPNLFRRLFGEGALSAVFVPVFTRVLDQEGRPAAWVLLGRITGLMALALSVVVLVLEGVAFAIATFSTDVSHLHLGLTAVMAPFMMGVCVVALFSSILNCVHHFTVPALLPIVLNGMIVVGAVVVGPMLGDKLEEQVYGVGYCVLAASVIQLAMILPVLRRHGVRFRLSLDRSHPDVRKILSMFIPVVLGQGVLLFNAFFDTQICTSLTRAPNGAATFSFMGREVAYPLESGALSAMNNAARLYQFPLGVLAISLATAAFPMFSLFASRKDFEGLRRSVAHALRLAIFVGAPSGLMLIILGRPIVSLLFEGGRFDAADTQRAADILVWYGAGMTAYCCQHILLRGFYSLGDVITPMKVSCVLVVVNLITTMSLIWFVQERIFGISTALVSFLHVCATVYLLRARLGGRMGARKIAASAARTVIATAAAGVSAWWVCGWLSGMSFDGLAASVHGAVTPIFHSVTLASIARTTHQAIVVFGSLGLAIAAFFVVGLALRMEEFGWLFKREAKPASA